MSFRRGNLIVIEPEPDGVCEMCGKVEELRPYGPNGMNVCFPCGMKNPQEAERQIAIRLFGEPDQKKLSDC